MSKNDDEHATGTPLEVLEVTSESGRGFEILGPCIQLASIIYLEGRRHSGKSGAGLEKGL